LSLVIAAVAASLALAFKMTLHVMDDAENDAACSCPIFDTWRFGKQV